ncbi:MULTISPECIES: nonribosomal peptide synthetase MxaA [Methylomonas]|uniref:nonribosomal peptide synthetase MxaA n=1 Tax=Methylomonas TaxID=416 RepID=UPI000ABA7D09|nr:nonribosomal peptide synthetase MxaA [Methylomonas koyamae]
MMRAPSNLCRQEGRPCSPASALAERRRAVVYWIRAGVLSLTAGLLAACSAAPIRPVSAWRVETPRPFGYQIGDTIPMRITVQTRSGVVLHADSLPKPGPMNRWLHLRQAEVEPLGDDEYRVNLEYQVFYAPLEVKALTIPGFPLRFSQHGQSLEERVPDWQFTVAPLRELIARQDEAGEYLRPDQPPARIADADVLRNLLVAGLAALALGLRLAWQYGYLPGLPRRSLFKRAGRQLRGLRAVQMAEALTVMHGALNRLHGGPLFGHRLEDFFGAHPHYRPLQAELSWFFDYSNRFFFADQTAATDDAIERLRRLCGQCRDVERGAR